MTISNLPAEVRSSIYSYCFSETKFKPAKYLSASRNGLFSTSWLSDIFTICKSIAYDPWLTQAILTNSTFDVENIDELNRLVERFGSDGLQEVTHISLGKAMTTDEAIQKLQTLMPKLNHVRLAGSVTPLWRVWDQCLAGFDKHAWAQFVACLCVFASGRTPGSTSILTDLVMEEKLQLEVDFDFTDPDFGTRRMLFSTKDWMLQYEYRGKKYAIKQVHPVDLEAVLDKVQPDLQK